MKNPAPKDQVITEPTYLEHIRHLFDSIDLDHMKSVANMDLATYDGVKALAAQIYFQTSGQKMPPEAGRKWSPERVQTFKNWIATGFPLGTVKHNSFSIKSLVDNTSQRHRMNANSLTKEDREKITFSFSEIMKRGPDDPTSYFALASIHWFPTPSECLHHEQRYNPWHRALVDRFEDNLRTVPGCETITLPYWDILSNIPDFLLKQPFAVYALPRGVHPSYPGGTKTIRFAEQEIYEGLISRDVKGDIETALKSASWEGFTSSIESAHDSGHVSIGPPGGMGRPDIASFDPIFWFFHCNWERLCWLWQHRHDAKELASFKSTIQTPGEPLWLTDPIFSQLPPFGITSADVIDVSKYSYEDNSSDPKPKESQVSQGSFPTDRSFKISEDEIVSLKVVGIERLRVAGSFDVHVFADGQSIAKKSIFQSSEPQKCENCRKHAKLDVAFRIPRDKITDRKIEIRFENPAADAISTWIPAIQVGNPKVSVREILTAL